MTFLASLRKEVLELARTYRLLVLAVVLVVFGLASPLLAKLSPQLIRMVPGGEDLAPLIPPPTLVDAIAQYIKNTVQFGLLLALLLPVGAVAQEKERGTAVLMLVKPLPRGTFLVTKFLALALAFLGSLALAGLAGYYYTRLLFEAPDLSAWVVMNLLVWLYLLVFVAISLLASTLVKSQPAAAGLAFGALMLFLVFSAIPGLGQYLPGQLGNWGATLFTDPTARSWPALGVSVGLVVVCLGAAWLVFQRQEL